MAERFMERHRSLMSDTDDVVRQYKKVYFRLWKFKLFKTKLVGLLIKARPRKRNEGMRTMKAELRAIGMKQDVEEILGEWEKQTHILKQEFSGGKAAVQHYLDSMQFPFHNNGREMPGSEEFTLRYDPVRKGYDFQRTEERPMDFFRQVSVADTGSVSWQTAYDEDPTLQ